MRLSSRVARDIDTTQDLFGIDDEVVNHHPARDLLAVGAAHIPPVRDLGMGYRPSYPNSSPRSRARISFPRARASAAAMTCVSFSAGTVVTAIGWPW